MMEPTLQGFENFVYGIMGVPVSALPPGSPVTRFSFDLAVEIVLDELAQMSLLAYKTAVYNLAADNLLNYAQDQPGQAYFVALQQQYGLFSFTPGVIASTADQSTSESLLNPEAMKNMTLGNLQNLKTPYGRRYMAIAQDYGPVWGVS